MANSNLQQVVNALDELFFQLKESGKDETAKIVCILTLISFDSKSSHGDTLYPMIKQWIHDNVRLTGTDAWPDILD